LIRVDNCDYWYGHGHGPALFSKFSLELEGGGVCGLLGRNGAGKSTLLRLLAGLAFPRSGGIEVLGYEPRRRRIDMLARMFFLPEDFHLPDMDGYEYHRLHAPFWPRFDEERFEACLDEFELTRAVRLGASSLGERKKFLLAFGLATGAELLLLDEPTNGLDIPAKAAFRNIIDQGSDEGRLYLVSTHQARDLRDVIDRVVIIDHGMLLFNRTLAETGRAIRFDVRRDRPAESLHAWRTAAGWVYATPGVTTGPVDIEALFEAVTNNPVGVEQAMNAGREGS
jgi:ABC-2 type transport system ATP-binding protein